MGEDNLNSQLHKYEGESFHERQLLSFSTIYMMGESPEEWKNSVAIPTYMKCGKQRVKNYSLMDVLRNVKGKEREIWLTKKTGVGDTL